MESIDKSNNFPLKGEILPAFVSTNQYSYIFAYVLLTIPLIKNIMTEVIVTRKLRFFFISILFHAALLIRRLNCRSA